MPEVAAVCRSRGAAPLAVCAGRLAVVALALASAAGCETLGLGEAPPERPPATTPTVPPGFGSYLDTLGELAHASPAGQAEIYADALAAVNNAPTTTNRLRLALIVSLPGHASYDPLTAQQQLGEILASADGLLPGERALARVMLEQVERQLVLESENRQLRAGYEADQAALEQAAARMQRMLEAENEQLREALAEAEAKLEAITTIEKTLRERSDGG